MLPVLAIALVVTTTSTAILSAPEQRYLEARDAATARFSKGEGPGEAERQAMNERRCLGPTLATQPSFKAAQDRAQKIIDQLEGGIRPEPTTRR